MLMLQHSGLHSQSVFFSRDYNHEPSQLFLSSWPLEILNAHPFVSGYEANEDKVHTEPLPADPDEPPPAPVMLADPVPAVPAAPVAPVSLDCSKMAYTEYTEPGQLTRTGSSPRLNLNTHLDSILLLSSL